MARLHPLEGVLVVLATSLVIAGYGLAPMGHPGFSLQKPPEDGIRVVTWNIGCGSENPRPVRDAYLAGIARTLNELKPDLVLLQEFARREQAVKLREILGSEWSVETHGGRVFSGLAVLTYKGSLRVTRNRNLRRRKALSLVYVKPGLLPVRVVNLHGDMLSSKKRNDLMGRALNWLKHEDQAILGGDLNLDVDLKKRGDLFTDDLYRDVETYNYLANRMNDVGLNTGSTAEPDRRLDYLFVSQGFKVINAGPWKGHRQGEMDHDPLIGDLVVSKTSIKRPHEKAGSD